MTEEIIVEETTVEIPAKFADLVKTIETLSVIELSELVKVLEKRFGVSAAAPAMMMAGPVAGGTEAPATEEKSEFNVELTDFGPKKEEAEAMKTQIEEAGGKVELK